MFFIVGLRTAEIMSLSTGRSLLRPGDERIISAVQGPQKKNVIRQPLFLLLWCVERSNSFFSLLWRVIQWPIIFMLFNYFNRDQALGPLRVL